MNLRQRIRRVLTAVPTLAFVIVPARGQTQSICYECLASSQARRWDTLAIDLDTRAQNLKRLRDLVARAQAIGDPNLVAQVRSKLAEAEADWNYIDRLANTLQTDSYGTYLAKRLAVVDSRVREVEAELQVKTEIFNRLRSAQASQKGKMLAEMKDLAEAEQRQRWSLGFNSLIATLDGFAQKTQTWLPEVHRYLGNAIDGTGKQTSLERLPELTKNFVNRLPKSLQRGATTLEETSIGLKVAQKEYFEAVTDAAKLVVDAAIKAKGGAATEQLGALPAIVGLSLDFTLLGQTHSQFLDTERRLQAVGSVESQWQQEMSLLGETLKNLRAVRERSQEEIRHQVLLKEKITPLRKELERTNQPNRLSGALRLMRASSALSLTISTISAKAVDATDVAPAGLYLFKWQRMSDALMSFALLPQSTEDAGASQDLDAQGATYEKQRKVFADNLVWLLQAYPPESQFMRHWKLMPLLEELLAAMKAISEGTSRRDQQMRDIGWTWFRATVETLRETNDEIVRRGE